MSSEIEEKHKVSGVIDLEFTKNDYLWEFTRYKTFTKWPFKTNAQCLPAKMAEAGWYCTNTDPDDPSAKCAFCLKELSGWERSDEPWAEHSKHNDQCPFVKLGKPERDCTVANMFHLLEARMLKILEVQHQENLRKLEERRMKIVTEIKKKYKQSM
uniref:Uncharacterized protein n=1 Tax=Homalodisca liturata TaxID=320908 RepID=A0A1B6HEA9_9HEMI